MTPLRFLAFVQRVALVTTPSVVACAGAAAVPTSTKAPVASSSSAASSVGAAPGPSTIASASTSSASPADPCRCSWETNAQAAPRVCKQGEVDHAGKKCVPATHPSSLDDEPMMLGPLPPPDLSAV